MSEADKLSKLIDWAHSQKTLQYVDPHINNEKQQYWRGYIAGIIDVGAIFGIPIMPIREWVDEKTAREMGLHIEAKQND